jgi:hypothetical protein
VKVHFRIACAALIALGIAGPAKAGVLYWDFSFSGDGVVGSGELITSDTADPNAPLPGGLDILSVDGMVNGDAITGLLGGVGPVETSPDGRFYYDNDFYAAGAASAAGGYFDDDGLLFTTAETSYNLFFDGTTYWDYADDYSNEAVSFDAVDPPPPSAVSEPGTGVALATALAALLVVLRRKERQARAAAGTTRR